MKAKIEVYLEDGVVLMGSADLTAKNPGALKGPKHAHKSSRSSLDDHDLDFSMPVRPFIKRYGAGLSGPKKLTLLIARLTNAKRDEVVSRSDVEQKWSKMKAIMGGRPYNAAYDTRARDQGWIHSPKPGSFSIRAGWEAILRMKKG